MVASSRPCRTCEPVRRPHEDGYVLLPSLAVHTRRFASSSILAVALILASVAPCKAAAQQAKVPSRPSTPVVRKADSTATESDSTADGHDDEEGGADRRFASGVSVGGLDFPGGRTERATSAIFRYRPVSWLSIGISPTFAHSSEPTGLPARPTFTASGLTDIPVDIGAEHSFDVPLSPSLGLGLGVTLPVGDSASGLGAGSLGASLSLSGGISPVDRLGVHGSVGRSLTDFSIQSSFNGSSTYFGDAGVSFEASDHFSLNLGLDGDIGHLDSLVGRPVSIAGGVSFVVPLVSSISLNASHGISGTTPSWSFAIGMGTEFAPLHSTAGRLLSSASTRLRRAVGGGRHGKKKA